MVYNAGIPLSTDLVSNSQSQLLDNFGQLNTQFGIDHTAFAVGGSNGDGFHKKVTLSTKNTPGAQTDPSSAVYTASGTASTVADLFFKNQNGTFPISPIKAWGFGDGVSGGITGSQSSNVTSFTRSGTGQYSVTIPANILNSSSYLVIPAVSQANSGTSPDQLSVTYSIINSTSFNLKVVNVKNNVVVDPTSLSFIVLQI